MEIDDDYKFLFVFGPQSRDKLSARDPLILSEKQHILKRVLPSDLYRCVIMGDHQYTSSLFQALVNVYNRVKQDGVKIHLNVVGGDGDAGVANNDKGASADQYLEILGRANHTKYPTGVTRMAFDSIEYHRQPRGEISGSAVRQAACSYNYTCEKDIERFRQLLHSGFDRNLARGLMKIIQERTSGDDRPS